MVSGNNNISSTRAKDVLPNLRCVPLRPCHIPFVFVNKIDAALEVLVRKSTDFAGRPSSPSRKNRLPGMEDRHNLSYTEAVLRESIRLSSVVPGGIFHLTKCDTELSGYRVPKETTVVINIWALHHDPDAWEEPDRFVPERFLDDNGKLGPKSKNWSPFSAGVRVCLGNVVAKPELLLLFACLMQRYTWKLESGRCPDLNPTGSVVLHSAKPYKVIVQRRV